MTSRVTRFAPAFMRRWWAATPEMDPVTNRFADPSLERDFDVAYFRDSLSFIRIGHVLGIVLWAVFGVMAYVALADHPEARVADAGVRFGLGIPIVAVSLALTYTRTYPRLWKQEITAMLLLSAAAWSSHRIFVPEARPDWGYAGLMLILAFVFIFSKLPFVWGSIVGVVVVLGYNVIAILIAGDTQLDLVLADFFLFGFLLSGMAASYALERGARVVFLRERELDHERARVDRLLRNTLPEAIVDRLKARDVADREPIADDLPEVSVVFADLVGFTAHAGRIAPDALVDALDRMFTRFDALAARFGAEKIKTVGDAYMAVTGAPAARDDHAACAARLALAMLEDIQGERWPTGDPMAVRIGIASGPAVAGVIGRQKFAYDLWGDTVNLASRLESNGEPGRILVSVATRERLGGDFRFGGKVTLDLKGKGPTVAWFLEG